jgi:hypothetical protein
VAIAALEDKNATLFEQLELHLDHKQKAFYGDLFLLLSVWLKNSIKYDQEMPPMRQAVLNSGLYVKALQYLRDDSKKWFLLEANALEAEILDKYLGLLINQFSP